MTPLPSLEEVHKKLMREVNKQYKLKSMFKNK